MHGPEGIPLSTSPGALPPVAYVKCGEKISILDEQDPWDQVRTADGTVGYIMRHWVSAGSSEDNLSELPREWNTVLGGDQVSVRVLGEHIYIQSEFINPVPSQANNMSLNCDGLRQRDKWVGECRFTVTLLWQFYQDPTTCSLSLHFEVTSISKQRIEGTIQDIDPPRNVGSCPTPSDKNEEVALIPRF